MVTRPVSGQQVCGDGTLWCSGPRRAILCLADGLGHGPDAAFAAATILDHIPARAETDLKSLFQSCDEAARGTRGAALAVAMIQPGRLTFASVGNIRAVLLQARPLNLPGDNGIVGGRLRRLVPFECPWRDGDVLVMWTDGLPSTLPFDIVPDALLSAPESLCAWLVDRFATGLDDAGVACVVLKGMS